jgi:hypothetical protein
VKARHETHRSVSALGVRAHPNIAVTPHARLTTLLNGIGINGLSHITGLLLLLGLLGLGTMPVYSGTRLNPSPKPVFKFVAIGDTGSRLPGQYQTANALVKSWQQDPFQTVLLLGDNIYPHGDVKQFGYDSFTKPYGPLLKQRVKFLVSLGNHDVLFGYRKAQLIFFNMPASYYSVKKGVVDFFVIDTNDFNRIQQRWLAMALGNSKAPWRVVFGHHPVFSSGKHGGSADLEKTLSPILKAHHVDLYLAGHEHEYERFSPIDGVTYIVSGGGGAVLRPFADKPDPRSLVRHVSHHFVRLQATASALSATVLDPSLSVLDQFSLSHATVKTAVTQP